MKKLTGIVLFCLILITLAACGPAAVTPAPAQPTTAPAAQTQPQPAAPTAAPAVPAAPTTAAAPTAAAVAPPASARGQCGTLKLLWWQAPTVLNPHLSQGTKDYDASRLVYEPLAAMGPDGVPDIKYGLAEELPTLQNGGISADGKTITWKLKKGVKWSDGSAFTAEDVVFTYQFVAEKKTAAVTAAAYDDIEKIEKIDDNTVKITWKAANSTPYVAFVGSQGMILPKKIFADFVGEKATNAPANLKPMGTGPWKVKDFKPNDVVQYEANENFRDPNKPCFKEVNMKGGGDATSAARAVLQTGDVDYSWNLQVTADLLLELAKAGKGDVLTSKGASVERIQLNRTNSNADQGDKRSEPGNPHPFLTDLKVRQALSYASDRKSVAEQLYGGKDFAGGETCNVMVAPPAIVSTTKFDICEFNLDKANKLLDEAGWVKGTDGVRAKGGVKLSVIYQTSVNPVRQKTQEIIKQSWEKIGVKVELKAVQAGVFFSNDAGNPDTYPKFFTDVQMYTNGPSRPDDIAIARAWTCAEVNSKSAEWRKLNIERYCNPEYDKLVDQLAKELDPGKRATLWKQLNDILINDVVMIPLVQRNGVAGKIKALKGPLLNTWDSDLWNALDWTNK